MSTRAFDQPDDAGAEIHPEELVDEARALDDDAFRTVDGAQSDEPLDPSMAAVIEAGGGVAEGFEQAEAQLVDNASEGPFDGTERILVDAFESEAEKDRAVYGEPDEEHSSEGGV